MIAINVIMACAPNVAPMTMKEIIRVESHGNPLAVNPNVKWVLLLDKKGNKVMETAADGTVRPKRRKLVFQSPIKIKTANDAIAVTHAAIAAGYSVDMGYMQINSSNLSTLGYKVEDMFQPCKNLAAGARVLTTFYSLALSKYKNKQVALRAALSAYNTGNFTKGFINGYLARYGVNGQSAVISKVPTINPYTAETAVFIRNPSKGKTYEHQRN